MILLRVKNSMLGVFIFFCISCLHSIVGMDRLPNELVLHIISHAFVPVGQQIFCVSGEVHRLCVQQTGGMNDGATGACMLAPSVDNYVISYGTVQKFRGAFVSCRAFWRAYIWYIKQRKMLRWIHCIDAQKFVDTSFLYRLSMASVACNIEALQITAARNMTLQSVVDVVKNFPRLRTLSVLHYPMYDETLESLNVCEKTTKDFRKKIAVCLKKSSDKCCLFDTIICCLFFYA